MSTTTKRGAPRGAPSLSEPRTEKVEALLTLREKMALEKSRARHGTVTRSDFIRGVLREYLGMAKAS